MSVLSNKYRLSVIVSRYFVPSHKKILHYGDCAIYLAQRFFCSCGLLHQLQYLDHALATIIFPKFEDELYYQDRGKKKKKSKKETAEAMAILEKVFGPIQKSSFEELKMDYDDYNKILNSCFTKKTFPYCFQRLKAWLKKEVSK